MRAHMIVLLEPLIDDGSGLLDARKPFRIEDFSAQRSVEALVISILPRGAGVDVYWLNTDFGQPLLQWRCDEFRTVV